MLSQKFLIRRKVFNQKKDTIKIISINKKTKTQLKQGVALRFSSSTLVFTGKVIFSFLSFKTSTEL